MKRLFTALMGVALAASVVSYLTPRGSLEAATPLPSGCYTDSSGLPVCGPNYPGPGGTPGPGGVTTVQATATACGAPPIVTNPTPSPIVEVPVCATASPGPSLPLSIANGGTGTAAPAPTSSNGCTVTGTWPSQTFACPTAGAAALPSTSASPPIVVATPAGQVNISCPTCVIANTGNQTGLTLASSAPTSNPSPQPGFAQVNGGFYVGPATAPSVSPNAFAYQMSSTTSCITSSLGTSASTAAAIIGNTASFYCGGVFKAAIGQNGDIAAVGNLYAASGIVYADQPGEGSGDCPATGQYGLYACTGGNNFGVVELGGPGSAGTNYCQADWNRATSGYFNIGCPVNFSNSTQNVGQVSCTLSTLVCSATATVRSGATCVAAYDGTATTVTAALLLPLTVKVVTTTMTVAMQGAATATGTAAADYWCT